ncbi:hypothetical protein RB200_04420 [Streptomyces sp. PmtG]
MTEVSGRQRPDIAVRAALTAPVGATVEAVPRAAGVTMARRSRDPFPVDVAEGGGWSAWTLTAAQVDTLSSEDARKLIEVRPAGRGAVRSRWELRARRTVGAVRLGTAAGAVQLRIAPKVTVDRLLYLLAYAPRWARWQPDPVDAAVRNELFPAIAHTFARAAEQALGRGPLSGYRGREDTSMMLRGRLRAAAQLRSRPGLALPLEISVR